MIFLRSTPEIYESARAAMDVARGLPSRGQVTSFSPAAEAPTDENGRVYLALRDSDLAATGAGDLLTPLVQAGHVEIVDEATYRTAFSLTQED
jgi:hypothetical protein